MEAQQQEEETKTFKMGGSADENPGLQPERVLGLNVDKLDERIISPQKLKDIFDQMTEIDTNPQAKSSQKFQEQLEEMERKNTNKKSGQITIKTVRRGRVRRIDDEMFDTDQAGRIQMRDKRFVQYEGQKYDKEDFSDFKVREDGKEIKIKTYWQPTDPKFGSKGAVFFLHGTHDYAGRYSWMARNFASQGYDFFAIDARGHGHSEGKRGYFGGVERSCILPTRHP